MDEMATYRTFLKDDVRKKVDFRHSDQHRGVPPPPMQLQDDGKMAHVTLPAMEECRAALGHIELIDAIGRRRSRRNYNDTPLSLAELAFLLWATQGQRQPGRGTPHFRTVPSAGARHSFETYLFIQRVDTVAPGLYRYLPLSHELVLLSPLADADRARLIRAVFGQRFVADGAVVFIWATVPYRMEWRYLQAAHRVILLDAGHVCQNLYLACEAIGAGTCAVAAYDQQLLDEMLQLDGEEQFAIYLAPVGKH